MAGIGVISNPRSGRNRRNPHLARKLAYILGEKNILAEPDRPEGLVEVARRFLEHEIEILAINGGDGTSHFVLTTFLQVYGTHPLPKIALLRGGTMNTIPRNIGLKGTPEGILGRLVAAYHADAAFSIVERNLIVVDGVQAGFLFGNGILSSFLEAYYEGGDASPWKAVKVLARTVGSAIFRGSFVRRLLRPTQVRVKADGRLWPDREFLGVAAGTVADIGMGFRPFYQAPTHPDHIHAIGMACPVIEVVKVLHRVRMGLPTRHPRITDEVCRRMVIESDTPQPFMVDGDFHVGGQTVVVEAGPRIQLVVV